MCQDTWCHTQRGDPSIVSNIDDLPAEPPDQSIADDTGVPSYDVINARLDALGASLAATRAIRDVAKAGPALDANLAELRAIRRVLATAAAQTGDQ